MRGNAVVWYREASMAGEDLDTWNQFKEGIMAQFAVVNCVARAREALYEIQQKGSVAEYVGRFRNLAVQVEDLNDAEKRHCFLRGLKPNVRREVELKDPGSFHELTSLAERVDRIDWNAGKRNFKPKVTVPPFVPKRPAKTFVPGQARGDPMELDMMKQRVKCFNCGKHGHIAANCPEPKRSPVTNAFATGANKFPPGGRGSGPQCFKCGKRGHIARDCMFSIEGLSLPRGPRQEN